MAYSELPKLKKNSVSTTLSSGINDTDTTIPVTELSVFYDADSNLITKGIVIGYDNATDTYAEEITITGTSGTSGAGNLTGATRGVNADGTIGAAKAHIATTNIAVMFSTGIYELIRENDIDFETTKADLASPVFTGTPTAPTAPIGTDTTQIATTAFVQEATRQILTANTTYYVATTGSDVTGDGTSGNPWATIQHAYDYIVANLDTAGYTTTIQVADGTYTTGLTINCAWAGGGNISIVGNTGDVDAVVISTTSAICYSFSGLLPGDVSISYQKLQSTTSGNLVHHYGTGTVSLQQVEFGACAGGNQIYADGINAKINIYGNAIYISGGGAYAFMYARSGANINGTWSTITMLNDATSGYFIYADTGGIVTLDSSTISEGIYTFTGTKYNAHMNAIIQTSGLTLPGTIAGLYDSGGQYS